MAENTVSPNAPGGTPTNGDPNLGPNDLCLEVELVLVSKEGVPVRQEAGLRLSNALTPAAKVAAAVQSTMELMRQSAIAQLSEAILRRCPQPKQELGRINRRGNTRTRDTRTRFRPAQRKATQPSAQTTLG